MPHAGQASWPLLLRAIALEEDRSKQARLALDCRLRQQERDFQVRLRHGPSDCGDFGPGCKTFPSCILLIGMTAFVAWWSLHGGTHLHLVVYDHNDRSHFSGSTHLYHMIWTAAIVPRMVRSMIGQCHLMQV